MPRDSDGACCPGIAAPEPGSRELHVLLLQLYVVSFRLGHFLCQNALLSQAFMAAQCGHQRQRNLTLQARACDSFWDKEGKPWGFCGSLWERQAHTSGFISCHCWSPSLSCSLRMKPSQRKADGKEGIKRHLMMLFGHLNPSMPETYTRTFQSFESTPFVQNNKPI